MALADPYLECLGNLVTTSAAATTPSLAFAPRTILWIEIYIPSFSSGDIPAVQFNGDTGNNYVDRQISLPTNTAVLSNAQTASHAFATVSPVSTTTQHLIHLKVFDFPGLTKVGISMPFTSTGAVATAAGAACCGFEWNSTARISSIVCRNFVGTATFGIGTSIRVFGSDV